MDSNNSFVTSTERMEKYLSSPLHKTISNLNRSHQERTTCFSYICPHASRCKHKTTRPANVLLRDCVQQNGKSISDEPNLSNLSLDLLAKRRKQGASLSIKTLALLDAVRPNGPLR